MDIQDITNSNANLLAVCMNYLGLKPRPSSWEIWVSCRKFHTSL